MFFNDSWVANKTRQGAVGGQHITISIQNDTSFSMNQENSLMLFQGSLGIVPTAHRLDKHQAKGDSQESEQDKHHYDPRPVLHPAPFGSHPVRKVVPDTI
jgi:hypothetical protein